MILKWTKAWWSLEGFMLLLVPALILFVFASPLIGIEWLLKPENGFGRLAEHKSIALVHGLLALLLLYILPLGGNSMMRIKALLGWIAIFAGFYSFWYPGPVATTFPLVVGSIRFAIPWRFNHARP